MSGLAAAVVVGNRNVDVAVEVAPGSVTAVLGPNGAGKSTLLRAIAGLITPDTGRIEIAGTPVFTARTNVAAHKRRAALLEQQPLLFPHLSVLANVAFAPRSTGQSRAAAKRIATQWLDTVGAGEFAGRRPHELSGGQAQRIAIARALAASPQVMLLDEPLAALDVSVAGDVRTLLREVLRGSAMGTLLVTHDPLDALAIADQVVVIENGRVAESGSVRSVFAHPRSGFLAELTGLNLVAGSIVAPGELATPAGGRVVSTGGAGLVNGSAAVAVFDPGAVAVYASEPPAGSPRNHFAVTVTGLDRGASSMRVRGDNPAVGRLSAEISFAAAAELDLAPGTILHFVVKATEVRLA